MATSADAFLADLEDLEDDLDFFANQGTYGGTAYGGAQNLNQQQEDEQAGGSSSSSAAIGNGSSSSTAIGNGAVGRERLLVSDSGNWGFGFWNLWFGFDGKFKGVDYHSDSWTFYSSLLGNLFIGFVYSTVKFKLVPVYYRCLTSIWITNYNPPPQIDDSDDDNMDGNAVARIGGGSKSKDNLNDDNHAGPTISAMLTNPDFLSIMEEIQKKSDEDVSELVGGGTEGGGAAGSSSSANGTEDGAGSSSSSSGLAKREAVGFSEEDPEYQLVTKCNVLVREIEEEILAVYNEVRDSGGL